MFCPNCGKQLEDNAQFCIGCGTPVNVPAQPTSAVSDNEQLTPKKPKRKKWIPIVAIVAAIVILLAAVAGLLLSSTFGGSKSKVFVAFAKSADAFFDAAGNSGIEMPTFITDSGAISHSISLGVQDLPSAPELAMIDLQVDLDSNLKDRQLYLSIVPSVASSDIFAVEIGLENELLMVRVPNLIGDQVYSFNTTSFGQDLYALGGMDEEVASLGFNVFELIETVKSYIEPKENMAEELAKLGVELVNAIETEKTGKKEISVHNQQVNATVYRLTITEESLKQLCKSIMDLAGDVDYVAMVEELLNQVGLPDYLVEEVMNEITYSIGTDSNTTEAERMMEEVIHEIGAIQIDVFVNKGYVCALEWKLSVYDADFELAAMIGNADSYTDEVTVDLHVNDQAEIILHSQGNHSYENKEFTDTTTLDISGSAIDPISITMDTRYAPKESANNFQWEVSSDFFRVGVEGQVSFEKDQITADLDSVELEAMDQILARLNTTYQASAYEPATIDATEGIELLKMSTTEIMMEIMSIGQTVEERLGEFAASSPELMEIIEGMM